MPGPFPGMDPFLEGPAHWHGFHNRLIFCISEALNAILPPGFAADIEERLYVVTSDRTLYPDVSVLHQPPERSSRKGATSTAVLEQTLSHGLLTAYPIELHEWYVEIRTTTKPRQIVTVVEILSPANKAGSSEGRQEYLQKQRDVLHSETHLLEIDLLRRGAHTVAAPFDRLRERGTWDYLVCLHRSAQRYTYEYWMNRVRESLPTVSVPLTPEHEDVPLDLQAVFNRAYDSGRYPQEVDYREEPLPPLEGEDAAWMDALLREKALRG